MNNVQYYFKWDFRKAFSNLSKHGVSFEEAATIFRDPEMISIFDSEHSEYEDRWISIGLSKTGKLLVVWHTFIDVDKEISTIRIFSSIIDCGA